MHPSSLRAPNSGFTLIELLVLLVVLAVVISLAGPSMSGVTARSSTRGAIGQLSGDIAYARILAVREGVSTAVNIHSSTRYTVTVEHANGADTAKTVELASEYPGLSLVPGSATLEFDSRGLLSGGYPDQIKAVRGTAADSVLVTATGRTYRDY